MIFVFMSLITRKVCNYKSIHYTTHEMSIVKVTKLFLQRPVDLVEKLFKLSRLMDFSLWYLILKDSKYPKCFIELGMKIRFLTFGIEFQKSGFQPSSIYSWFTLRIKICVVAH